MSASATPDGPAGASNEPVVWGNVPQRNINFTGRSKELADLRSRMSDRITALVPHTLQGLGGVGKTQLAVEYVYRYASEYEVVWWVSADQPELLNLSLAGLAPRLGLDIAPGKVEEAAAAAGDALRRGSPYQRWLLVFDNADQPEQVRGLLPGGAGHVLITSRDHRWKSLADTIEVNVFDRGESLEFLQRRVRGISESDAERLAEQLGDLPLALEQAGALQAETAMSVDEYLELLETESRKLLGENRPVDYPVPVAAAWNVAISRLREQTPLALDLLNRCAFLGPEPIKRDLFKQGRYLLEPPLRDNFGDTIKLGAATRELGRYALVRVDNNQRTLQVHRLIQLLIREGLTDSEALSARSDAHLLLAGADPDAPEDIINTRLEYQQLLVHVTSSEAVTSESPEVRALVRNVVLFLYYVGDYSTCETVSASAIDEWTGRHGEDDPELLLVKGYRANMLWALGRYVEAFTLRVDTLRRMERHPQLGPDHLWTLDVRGGHGADLRARGDFNEARDLDEQTLGRYTEVVGDDDRATFRAANNLALDYSLSSDYERALKIDRRTFHDRRIFFGRDDEPYVVHSLSAIGRDLRQCGQYAEALQTETRANALFAQLVRQGVLREDHYGVMQQAKDLSVAKRKMGLLREALELAERVHVSFVTAYGEQHPDTLSAAMNLGNARRVCGDFYQEAEVVASADSLIKLAYEGYVAVYGPEHPYTYGCALNLAIVRRRLGEFQPAADLLENALEGLERRLGRRHHYTLTCQTALATSMSELGQVQRAVDLGRDALAGLSAVVGPDHPHTLACMANLSLDLNASGEIDESESMRAAALDGYSRTLGLEHFDAADAAKAERIALDFEPPPL